MEIFHFLKRKCIPKCFSLKDCVQPVEDSKGCNVVGNPTSTTNETVVKDAEVIDLDKVENIDMYDDDEVHIIANPEWSQRSAL